MPNNNNPIDKLKPIKNRISYDYATTLPLESYSNEYDAYYRPEYNQEWNRSSNQAWLEQLYNGVLSRTLSIAPKIGMGAAAVWGAVSGDELSDVWDNPWMEVFNNMDENLRESIPVYRSMKYDTGGF